MRVYFIRHGQTHWNIEHRAQGLTNIALDEIGALQAHALGEALLDTHFDAIYSSPLMRAVETARPICESSKAEMIIDEDLTEMMLGDWEGMTFDEIDKVYPSTMKQWRISPFSCLIPGAEKLDHLLARVLRFLDKLNKSGGHNVAVISHTLPLKVAIAHLICLPLDSMHVLRFDNTGITQVEISEDGRNVLVGANDISHLKGGEHTWGTLQ